MSSATTRGPILTELARDTIALIRLSAALAAGTEEDVRSALLVARDTTPHPWIEELLLQTYLFAGFPRALNGMREWRRLHPTPTTSSKRETGVRAMGEKTCAAVYGEMYDKLRTNIRALHPDLDDWMILEGYGKVLSRPELDLQRRELCIVAACAATGQDRQLQSHLHGARNVGVAESVIGAALESLRAVIPAGYYDRAVGLWQRIRNDVH